MGKLTILCTIILVTQMLYQCIALTVVYLLPNLHDRASDLLNQIAQRINCIFEFAILYTWCWRFYLLSYECKCLVYINKNKWQTAINPFHGKNNRKHLENYWYLAHKQTFGNIRYIGKYFIVPLIA